MLLIAFALALLALYAGMKLLALTKKDALGNMFKYMSWFIIIMSFLIFLCVGAHSLKHHWMHNERCMIMKTEMRGNGCMESNSCHSGMIHDGCCDGNMHMGGCCGHSMNGCCNEMNDGCKQGMSSSCNGDMKGTMKGCPMEKKDSVVKKK